MNLYRLSAHWVLPDTILWNAPLGLEVRYSLVYDLQAQMRVVDERLEGGRELPLDPGPEELPPSIRERFPHLQGMAQFKLQRKDLPKVRQLLKGQVVVAAYNRAGRLLAASGLQIPGVVDALFDAAGKLGVSFEKGAPVLRLWAPTAQEVALVLYDDEHTSRQLPLALDPASGVWSIRGKRRWVGKFYQYAVTVYAPCRGAIVTNLVTDPYSISLSTNSRRSQIIDLNERKLFPRGWKRLAKPPLEAPEDSVLYELHVRDFSAYAADIPPAERGTYKAFTHLDAAGMKHLKALAASGLTHVHLLPVFDIATIDEDRRTWKAPDPLELAQVAPDSPRQQALVGQSRGADGYNWGYDPYHFNTPEGSYAVNPEGAGRILEFRQMVQALNSIGLRVVMDVVYNHTHAAGMNDKSVLDKVVPGYYHRLSADGKMETSTCCQNTASEQRMMEKLIIDSLLLWATAYKVDGFRFDLMGHHLRANMLHLRQALDGLTPEKDGVDGKAIILYGEGWNFGEMVGNQRGVNASQLNIGGTGVGVFNDRLRDGARGGSAFEGLQQQGFINGLYDAPNASATEDAEGQRRRLMEYGDWIKIGLAGNLADYPLTDRFGHRLRGADIDYKGQPAGYTADPQENVLYISAHDNETLFDAIQLKAPASASLAERGRMQILGLSLVLLGQGLPFIHAGDEILRSKSFDRNSYQSGDWFNHIDFTLESNNFGIGLPPEWDNRSRWEVEGPLLANAALKPQKSDLEASLARFLELLAIRKSSPLFRLRSREEILRRLAFTNAGPEQIPGVIVMHLVDLPEARLDPNFRRITVLFNATQHEIALAQPELAGTPLVLHPVQLQSADPRVRQARFDASHGIFHVPGRTTAVFVAVDAAAKPSQLNGKQ